MLDAEIAATDAATLARFAERVREADRAPTGPSADRVRRMLNRADLVRSWPVVRATLVAPPPTADATLAERSRQLAERCRTSKGGWLGQWPTELLGEAAERLVQLAERLDAAHTPTGIVAQLNAVLAGWSGNLPTAQLVQLDATLAGLSDACGGLLHALADQPLGHVFEHFDTKLTGWPADTRAAAGVLCLALDHLTQRTSDPQVWGHVRRWADGWFAANSISGAVLLDEPPADGVIVESFPLPGSSTRVMLVLVPPGGVVEPPDEGPAVAGDDSRPDARPAAEAEWTFGPLPAGFAELERAGGELPKGNELRKLVAGLRGAAEGDYLREAVLGLYSDFWGDAGNAAREMDPDATADVGERLNALLADAYGLRPFFPANVHDLPSGWIAVAAGSRVMTGVVTRVLRPGLQDDHGHLRIPAVVEVE